MRDHGPGLTVASDRGAVIRIAAQAAGASTIGLDVEANGLFAYQASLCVLTITWEQAPGQSHVAVIDPRATSIDPLHALLGPEGPIKVVHDLHFDARMLAAAGAPLGRVRDTSVAAMLLGYRATGLATLLASELGVTVDKRLQQHDWSRRPLTEEHLSYLAGDVIHLLALDAHFAQKADAMDIAPEIEDECRHRLARAITGARREGGGESGAEIPAYARIKGAHALDAAGRAVLRELTEARDRAARADDVPPFKIVGNSVLLDLARARPATLDALLQIRGAGVGRAASHARSLVSAVQRGVRAAEIPPDHARFFERPSPDRKALMGRRAAEARISAFRRAEAKRRGVDEQVILPGHCAQDLADLLVAHDRADPALPAAIASIAGLGARRIERYGEALRALAAEKIEGREAT